MSDDKPKTTKRLDDEAAAGDAPLESGLTPFGLHPAVKEALKQEKRQRREDERRMREQIAADLRAEAAKAVAAQGNGKPRIPASWVPFLLVGSALSTAVVTTAALMPNDIPRVVLVVASVALATFGPLLAASPGLRKGQPK